MTVDRLQFTLTVTFHYLFPILTMGVALFVAWLKTVSYLGRDDHPFPLWRKTKADWDASRATRDRSLRRYESAQARYDMTMNGSRLEDIAEAEAEVGVAKARLRKAEWHLANCTIRAPVSGTILTKKAELGNLVNPLAFGATSGAVCEMADLSDLEVELDVTERDIAKVQKDMLCRLHAEAYPDRIYNGVVTRLMPIANRAKGSVPVRVKVRVPPEEEGVYLKPEMGAVVAFLQPARR